MTSLAATRILVICDGAVVPPAVKSQAWDQALQVNAEGNAASLNLKVENLTGKVVASIDRRAQDLIRIAAGCYGADQMVSRGGIDIHREHWRREFLVIMPVIDRTFWSEPSTTTALVEALGFGTDDTWRFEFTDRPAEIAQMRLLNDEPWRDTPDSVVLFSGGTDSLCALVEAVMEHGRRPLIVSHRSAGHIDRWQRDLLEALREHVPGWRLPHMSFWIHKKRIRASDVSQRTRGFLFAALGTAVAGQIGVSDVLLPDNGYVSVNPPISGQLVGALASRGTHPAFFRLFNRLAALIFATPVVVSNPLARRTRAEALSVLARHNVPHLISMTHTCGKHQLRTTERPHCGGCSQCVDRRFSTIAAGLAEYDPANTYVLDVFRDALPAGEARTITLSYVDFARKTERATSDELLERYEELLACLDPDAGDVVDEAQHLGRLLNRHGREVVTVLANKLGDACLTVARGDPESAALFDLLAPPGQRQKTDILSAVSGDRFMHSVAESKAANSLRHRAGVWHVCFHGQKATVVHRKGVTQLALLLQSPNQALDVVALARSEALPARTVKAAPNGFAPGIGGSLGTTHSEITIEHMVERKRQLPAEIESARARGRTELVGRLREDFRLIKQELKKARALNGRLREMDGPEELARKAVSKNVRDVLDRIDVDLHDCRVHLDESLYLGIHPVYHPEPPETWAIDF